MGHSMCIIFYVLFDTTGSQTILFFCFGSRFKGLMTCQHANLDHMQPFFLFIHKTNFIISTNKSNRKTRPSLLKFQLLFKNQLPKPLKLLKKSRKKPLKPLKQPRRKPLKLLKPKPRKLKKPFKMVPKRLMKLLTRPPLLLKIRNCQKNLPSRRSSTSSKLWSLRSPNKRIAFFDFWIFDF